MTDLRAKAEELVAKEISSSSIYYGGESSVAVFTKYENSREKSVVQVHNCLRFLDLVEQLSNHRISREKQPKSMKRISVYHAKHVVEEWCGRYVPSHAFIAAAKWHDSGKQFLRSTDNESTWSLPLWIYRLVVTIKQSDDFRPLLIALAEG